MSKKILITGLVFAGLLFFGLSGQCFANAAELLEQANTYKNTGYLQQARQLYNSIVQQYPGTDSALDAQSELIILDIPKKENWQIQAAIDSMIASYGSYEAHVPDSHRC